MKIGIYSVERTVYPNVALMKISAYHKQRGDSVEWALPLESYDIVYESKLFTFSPAPTWPWMADKVVRGGTGYDIESKLPNDIEQITDVDWSLYSRSGFSVNFLSRGCIRKCPFCLVRRKEGYIHPVRPLTVPDHAEWVEILDNNFFANPRLDDAAQWVHDSGKPITLNGVDVRMMTDDHYRILQSFKMHGRIHIAWDNPKDKILPKIEHMTKFISPWRIVCYVLVGFNSTIQEDLMRIQGLESIGVSPFVMVYRDYTTNNEPDVLLKHLQRWCNRREIFKSCTFNEYLITKEGNDQALRAQS